MDLKISWPEGKRFAFTVFDDTDRATLENVRPVYEFLADCGFRTTKSCWPLRGDPALGKNAGETLADPPYADWLLKLQARGFEIAWHGATWHGVERARTVAALDHFARVFGGPPRCGANHTEAEEALYWGGARLTGWHAWLYDLLTTFHNRGKYCGHVPGDAHFWGDLCRARLKYYRGFVFRDINTLKACPLMPYHDPLKPFVNYWFACSHGSRPTHFNECLAERHQDRLEEEGGACIIYTHFAFGFAEESDLRSRFAFLMQRLAKKNGWFVPVSTLLDYLLEISGHREITPQQRRRLERQWLWEKLLVGTT